MAKLLYDCHYPISDDIPSFLDTWFIGDRVLQDAFNTFQAVMNEGISNKKVMQPLPTAVLQCKQVHQNRSKH